MNVIMKSDTPLVNLNKNVSVNNFI